MKKRPASEVNTGDTGSTITTNHIKRYIENTNNHCEMLMTALKNLQYLAQQGSAGQWLEALITFELTQAETYRWPMYFWAKHPARKSEVSAVFTDAYSIEKHTNELEKIILKYAIAIRSQDKPFSLPPFPFTIFNNDYTPLIALESLDYSFGIELAHIAFQENNWPFLNSLGRGLIVRCPYPQDNEMAERLKQLLLDMVVYSLIRLAGPNLSKQPRLLHDQMTKLSYDKHIQAVILARTPSALVFEANQNIFGGQVDKANKLYEAAANSTGFRTPFFSPLKTILNINKLISMWEDGVQRRTILDWYDDQCQLSPVFRHAESSVHVVLASCDQAYFDRHAKDFIEIMSLSNPGTLVHFLLINIEKTEADIHKVFDNWESNYNIRINFTIENNAIMASDNTAVRGVSANSRYTHLPLYLEQYSGILIVDIDGWLNRDIASIVDNRDNDVLICSKVWRARTGYWRLPWANIAAGFFSLKSNTSTQNFAEFLSFYMKTLYYQRAGKGVDLFWADQAGTFFCLHHFEERGLLKVGFLKDGFSQNWGKVGQERIEARREGMQTKLKKLRLKKPIKS